MSPKTHQLKCDPVAFDAVRDGHKTFEVRRNDRLFQTGDLIELVRNDGGDMIRFSFKEGFQPPKGREKITRRIGWILGGGQYGIDPGFVVFAIEDPELRPARIDVLTDVLCRIRDRAHTVGAHFKKGGVRTADQSVSLELLHAAKLSANKALGEYQPKKPRPAPVDPDDQELELPSFLRRPQNLPISKTVKEA